MYDFDPTTFSATAGTLVPPLWQWNTQTNGGMDLALALPTAPALSTTASGIPLVMVGGNDGLVYAITSGAGSNGTQTPTNTIVTVPDGLWPFRDRDARDRAV